MNSGKRPSITTTMALMVTVVSTALWPPAGAAVAQLVCINPYPPGCGAPIYAEDEVQFDILPIAVIYHPPGGATNVGQTLTQTHRFGTTTTVTRTKTEDHPTMFSAPESLEFVKGTEAGEDEQWTWQTETGTTKVIVQSTSWNSGGPEPTFPGDGDRIMFYVNARFRVKFQLGVISGGYEHYYDPALISMTPIDGPWTTIAVTAWQLRTGDLPSDPSYHLDPDTVNNLLALDPFTGPGFDILGARALDSPSVRKRTPSSDPNLPERRFTQVSPIPDVWWPCGPSFSASQTVEVGESSSETTTRTHSRTTNVTGVGETTFTFEYSVNTMTEESNTTEAVARWGGGSECDADAPMYETETWYDTMSGTLAFPTREYPPGNVTSQVLDRGGGGLAGAEVLIEDTQGQSLRTRTDQQGQFRLYLEPGRYTLSAQELRGGSLGLSRSFEVDSTEPNAVKLEPLIIGGTTEIERPVRGPEAATPTSTPSVIQPDRDVRLPTPTATPGRPGITEPGPR